MSTSCAVTDMQRQSPHLAQELVDIIIDNLRDDFESLAACSLISRSWSFRSSLYLCHRVCVKLDGLTQCDALIRSLQESPRLSCAVQELALKSVIEQERLEDALHITFLRTIITLFPRMRVLELQGVSFRADLPLTGTISPPSSPSLSPRPILQTLRIRGYNIPHGLTDVMELFESITSIETSGLCWASVRPSCTARKTRTPVRSIVSRQSDPSALSSVLKQLRGCVLPEHVRLTMDDGIFSLTYLAYEFSQLLREVGESLKEIEFKLSPRIFSMVAQDLPLASLSSCTNLQSLSIQLDLGLESRAMARNAVSFAIACDIIHSACYRAPTSLDLIQTTIAVDISPTAGGSRKAQERALTNLKRLSWETLQEDLEIFGKKRPQLPQEKGVVFRVVAVKGLQEDLPWVTNELRTFMETSLSSRARKVIRFL